MNYKGILFLSTLSCFAIIFTAADDQITETECQILRNLTQDNQIAIKKKKKKNAVFVYWDPFETVPLSKNKKEIKKKENQLILSPRAKSKGFKIRYSGDLQGYAIFTFFNNNNEKYNYELKEDDKGKLVVWSYKKES